MWLVIRMVHVMTSWELSQSCIVLRVNGVPILLPLRQVQLLELLPKLSATIPRTTDKAALKSLQRRCEAAFKELVLHGLSGPVRGGSGPA